MNADPLLEAVAPLLARTDRGYLRDRHDRGLAHDPALWSDLAAVGLIGATVPTKFGGAGLPSTALGEVLLAVGAAALPGPVAETVLVAAPLLAASSDHPAAAQWLTRIAEGAVVTVAFPDRTRYVAYAEQADALVVAGAHGVAVHERSDVRTVLRNSVDPLHPSYQVELRGDGLEFGATSSEAERAWTRAVAGNAALLAGVATRLRDMTVEYVGLRNQFGRPVGSFQAVKHQLANLSVAVDMAASVSLRAIEELELSGADEVARAAKAFAGTAADEANVTALQLHGAIGFTWEHHLHFWLKRAMSLSAGYGTTTQHRRALAEAMVTAR